MSIKTRSGLMPTQSEIPYNITTSEIEEYIQGKVDTATKDREHVDVQVLTIMAGKKFAPVMAFFPESVSNMGKNQGNNNSSELSVFQSEGSSKVQLDHNIFRAIAPFTYNKDDEKAFFSPEWRRNYGVQSSMSPVLKAYKRPHLHKLQGGKIRLIGIMLDPIRIFHDMLSAADINEAKRERFFVFIQELEKIKDANVTYTVTREKSNGHGGKNKNIYDVLTAELSNKIK